MPEAPTQNGEMQVQAADVLQRIEQLNPDLFHRAVAEVQGAMLRQRLEQVNGALMAQMEEDDA